MTSQRNSGFYERPLFSFGTLQDADVFHIVSGGVALESIQRETGWIEDCLAYSVLNGLYPVLKNKVGGRASGILFFQLPHAVLDRLIWFEWPEFTAACISVGTVSQVFESTYFTPVHVPPASDQLWSLATWRLERKSEWIKHAKLAMHFYGVLSQLELADRWEEIVAYMGGKKANLPQRIADHCKTFEGKP